MIDINCIPNPFLVLLMSALEIPLLVDYEGKIIIVIWNEAYHNILVLYKKIS